VKNGVNSSARRSIERTDGMSAVMVPMPCLSASQCTVAMMPA